MRLNDLTPWMSENDRMQIEDIIRSIHRHIGDDFYAAYLVGSAVEGVECVEVDIVILNKRYRSVIDMKLPVHVMQDIFFSTDVKLHMLAQTVEFFKAWKNSPRSKGIKKIT